MNAFRKCKIIEKMIIMNLISGKYVEIENTTYL